VHWGWIGNMRGDPWYGRPARCVRSRDCHGFEKPAGKCCGLTWGTGMGWVCPTLTVPVPQPQVGGFARNIQTPLEKMRSTAFKLVTIAHHCPLHCVGALKHKKKVPDYLFLTTG
jgi:hypothetical protein